MASSTGKKGGKKIGRNKKKPCQMRYTMEKRWIKNKKRKLVKHIRKYANDTTAQKALLKIA